MSEPPGIPIHSNSPRFVEQSTGLFESLRNSLGWNTRRFLYALTYFEISSRIYAFHKYPTPRTVSRRWASSGPSLARTRRTCTSTVRLPP